MVILLGFKSIAFAVFTKLFAISEGLHCPGPLLDRLFRYMNLELGLLVGTALAILGFGISIYAVQVWGPATLWSTRHVAHLPGGHSRAAPSLTLGMQAIFSSFFLSVLRLRRR